MSVTPLSFERKGKSIFKPETEVKEHGAEKENTEEEDHEMDEENNDTSSREEVHLPQQVKNRFDFLNSVP